MQKFNTPQSYRLLHKCDVCSNHTREVRRYNLRGEQKLSLVKEAVSSSLGEI